MTALGLLAAIGARARWVLAAGVLLATLLPALSAALKPALPVLVALLFCVAMARIDLAGLVRAMLRPVRLLRLAALTVALLWATPALLWAAAAVAGAGPDTLAAIVYTGAAPPITSSAALCLILGLNAAFALELTIAASLAAPFLGPPVVAVLLGTAVPLGAETLALRMAAMVGAGALGAVLLRHLLGPRRIAENAAAFDGVSALTTLVFVVPLFDGFWAAVFADPLRAAWLLALAIALNYGLQALIARGARAQAGAATAGAAGLLWGNRTVALYLAALPPDPAFALFVALFQLPMLFTPLVMGRLLGAARARGSG